VLANLAVHGIKRWVVSNLAPPYAEPVRRLLAGMVNGFSFSFELGAIKPEPAIFAHACASLQRPAPQIMMVGDTVRADVEGARAFGMQAVTLVRGGCTKWPDCIESLQELASRLADTC